MGVDDTIEQWMRQAETNGELRSNPYFGKPLDLEDGYADTPEEMRMAYKVLKNAGHVPIEVEMMQEIGKLKEQAKTAEEPQRTALLRKADDLQLKVSMALERMRDAR